MEFYTLTLREIRRETPECVSLLFDVPESLSDAFRFIPGQYLTLRTTLDGQDVRRSYSICSAPHEGALRVAVKHLEGGLFSTYANQQLRVGDSLEVMPPQGRFVVPGDRLNNGLFVAFVAGSGITPVISMIKSVLQDTPGARFVLFYGNKGFDHIIFRDTLEILKNAFPDRLSVHHIFSRESMSNDLFQGHIDAEKCRSFARHFFRPTEVDTFFLCGPEEMVLDLKVALGEMEVAPERVKMELFTTSGSAQRSAAPRQSGVPAMEASVTVIQDGVPLEFRLPSDGSVLLDAAMRAGADLPFSCKGGVCSTCKAKVLQGEVSMDINYGLEPDEVAAGYILTCQAHPKTEKVVISFDE